MDILLNIRLQCLSLSISLGIMSSNSDKKTASQTDGKTGQTKKSDMGMGMMAYKVKSPTYSHTHHF